MYKHYVAGSWALPSGGWKQAEYYCLCLRYVGYLKFYIRESELQQYGGHWWTFTLRASYIFYNMLKLVDYF